MKEQTNLYNSNDSVELKHARDILKIEIELANKLAKILNLDKVHLIPNSEKTIPNLFLVHLDSKDKNSTTHWTNRLSEAFSTQKEQDNFTVQYDAFINNLN